MATLHLLTQAPAKGQYCTTELWTGNNNTLKLHQIPHERGFSLFIFFSPFPYSKIPQIIHEQLIQLFQLHFDHHLCVSWWKVFFSFIPSCPYPHSKCTAPVTAGRATQMVLFVHSKEMSTSALHPMVVIEEASMSSVFHGHHLYMGFLLSLPPLSSVTFSLYARSSSFQTLFSLWL